MRPRVRTWDTGQMRRFMVASAGDGYAPIWVFALATGMRRGELFGLRWQDTDLVKGRLHVHQGLVEIGSELRFQEPKTKGGRRVVPLPPECIPLLEEHRARQLEQRRVLGPAWRDHDLVFTIGDGGPIAPRNLIRRFKGLCQAAGLPPITFHGVRHAHATQLLRDGIAAKVVSERLGHASIAITLDTYSHVLPDMQATAVAAISEALFGDETTA